MNPPFSRSYWRVSILARAFAATFCVLASASVVLSQPAPPGGFAAFINGRFADSATEASKRKLDCAFDSDPFARRVMAEYGAMFAAADSVTLPSKCIYTQSSEVNAFQQTLKISAAEIGGTHIELQPAALSALRLAAAEAELSDVSLTPLDGRIAARRTYNDSVLIWNKRMYPALEYWVREGVITVEESIAVRNVPLVDQARQVMNWELRGYNFGTGRVRSIFASCSPPGTSQHLSLVAFDVVQYGDPKLRAILNRYGWYQTVANDPPHFTFLGLPETELPARGLKRVPAGGFEYWVPDIADVPVFRPAQSSVTPPSD